MLDADLEPHLVNAEDIVMKSPLSVSSELNMLEAMRDFGSWDVETLPVESLKLRLKQEVLAHPAIHESVMPAVLQ